MNAQVLRGVSREFNKYRAPECRARVIFNRGAVIEVRFSGTRATTSCCYDQHFIDYKYYLKDLAGAASRIIKVKRLKPAVFIVSFRLLNSGHNG